MCLLKKIKQGDLFKKHGSWIANKGTRTTKSEPTGRFFFVFVFLSGKVEG